MIVVVGHQPGQEAPVIPLGGINIGGGGSYNRLALSVHPFKQFIAQTTQRRPAVRGGTTPSNVPTTGGWLSFCVSREKLHADLNALLPVFRDRWQFLIQRRPLLCFQERDRPEWKWGFVFPFPVVFFNLCGFKRKLHTAEGCGRFSCYLSVKVVFKKNISLPLRPAL